MRGAVSDALDCPCVVLSTAMVERLVDAAREAIRALGHPATPPYRSELEGVAAEFCLVLASEALPQDAEGERWLFRQTRNAVALMVLERRALLTLKRRHNARGSRVTLGSVLNDPWKKALAGNGVRMACLTSRTVNTLDKVATKARALRE